MGRFTRDATERHECPHPTCTATISAYIFACRHHWFELPIEIRGHVLRAWRRITQGDPAGIAAHDAATNEAIAWWTDRLAA